MPAGVLPGARRHTIPLTDLSTEGGRVPGVPLEGPIVAPRPQIFLPDEDMVATVDATTMEFIRDWSLR